MKRAFLIGSSEFEPDSEIEQLKFPKNDIEGMERTLTSGDFEFSVTRVMNESNGAIIEKLDHWMGSADFEDFLLIYFSGHGRLNTNGDLFLSSRNTKAERLNSTALKWKHIMDLIEAHSRDRVGIILDCCYAGRAASGGKGGLRGMVEEQIRSVKVEGGRGVFILGASGAIQTAEEREIDGYGRFTKQILEGLNTGAADYDQDGKISLSDLAKYVKREMKKQKANQEPVEGGVLKSGELILGENRKKLIDASILTIKNHLDQEREKFSRNTFRQFEDYLDGIRGEGVDKVIRDNRYQSLKRYALGDGYIDHVLDAFRLPLTELTADKKSPSAELPKRKPESPPETGMGSASSGTTSTTTLPLSGNSSRLRIEILFHFVVVATPYLAFVFFQGELFSAFDHNDKNLFRALFVMTATLFTLTLTRAWILMKRSDSYNRGAIKIVSLASVIWFLITFRFFWLYS